MFNTYSDEENRLTKNSLLIKNKEVTVLKNTHNLSPSPQAHTFNEPNTLLDTLSTEKKEFLSPSRKLSTPSKERTRKTGKSVYRDKSAVKERSPEKNYERFSSTKKVDESTGQTRMVKLSEYSADKITPKITPTKNKKSVRLSSSKLGSNKLSKPITFMGRLS